MAKQMRKVRVGAVVRTTMDKTAVVEMVWRQRHPIYHKQMRRVARFYVHDPQKLCRVGDTVRIQETRPISKTKRWRLLDILQRRQVADVQPIELEGDVSPVMTGEALLEQPEDADDASESARSQDMSADDEEDARQ